MLTFVELLRSRIHRQARFSKHWEKINKDDSFYIDGLEFQPDEEPCGKFIPVVGLPEEYVLLTSLGLHWIEGNNATFFPYENLSGLDAKDLSKTQTRSIILITKQSQRVKFPKEYPIPIPSLFTFTIFVGKILDGYRERKIRGIKY